MKTTRRRWFRDCAAGLIAMQAYRQTKYEAAQGAKIPLDDPGQFGIRFQMIGGSFCVAGLFDPIALPDDGKSHHVAMSMTDGRVRCWVDGRQVRVRRTRRATS